MLPLSRPLSLFALLSAVRDSEGRTPLHDAAALVDADHLRRAPQCSNEASALSCLTDSCAALRMLLNANGGGAQNPKVSKATLDAQDHNGYTALHDAAASGNLPAVKVRPLYLLPPHLRLPLCLSASLCLHA